MTEAIRGPLGLRRETVDEQRRLRQSIPAFLRHSGALATLTTPVIYSMLFPLALFDLWITLYQWLCFPLCRIAIVPRDPFFVIDRHKLATSTASRSCIAPIAATRPG